MSLTNHATLTSFLLRSKLDANGNAYVETTNFRKPIFNAWSVDTTVRPSTQYKTVPYPTLLFEDTKEDGGYGALSLEHLVRRQIVKHHVGELDEKLLKSLRWFSCGKKVWEDVMKVGEDSFRVFARFCGRFGHELDFVAMLEREGEGFAGNGVASKVGCLSGFLGEAELRMVMMERRAEEGVPMSDFFHNNSSSSSPEGFTPLPLPIPQQHDTNSFRYRIQLIKAPFPPWAHMIPLLTSPTPKLNNNEFSWLVCLELTQNFDYEEAWSRDDLIHTIGTLPNLAALTLKGRWFEEAGNRIVGDGILTQWARQARMGERWAGLRVLAVHESWSSIIGSGNGGPGKRKSLFDELDSFPRLEVFAIHPEREGSWDDAGVDGRMARNRVGKTTSTAYTPTIDLVGDGKKAGWLASRRDDVRGTLKGRPEIIPKLVRDATVTGVRDLARAASLLVEVERREQREAEKRRSDNNTTTTSSRKPKKNPPPPVMVNITFQHSQNSPSYPTSSVLNSSYAASVGGIKTQYRLQQQQAQRSRLAEDNVAMFYNSLRLGERLSAALTPPSPLPPQPPRSSAGIVFEKKRGLPSGPRIWAADSVDVRPVEEGYERSGLEKGKAGAAGSRKRKTPEGEEISTSRETRARQSSSSSLASASISRTRDIDVGVGGQLQQDEEPSRLPCIAPRDIMVSNSAVGSAAGGGLLPRPSGAEQQSGRCVRRVPDFRGLHSPGVRNGAVGVDLDNNNNNNDDDDDDGLGDGSGSAVGGGGVVRMSGASSGERERERSSRRERESGPRPAHAVRKQQTAARMKKRVERDFKDVWAEFLHG